MWLRARRVGREHPFARSRWPITTCRYSRR